MTLTREGLLQQMEEALDRIGTGWSAWPECVTDRRMTPRDQLVALLLIMDASPELVNGWPYGSSEDQLVASLPRKSLPWDSDTAVFAIRAALKIDCMNYVCGPALRGAEKAMAAGHVDTALYNALRDCAIHLEGLMSGRFAGRWGVDKDRKLADRLLASYLPPGVLDLTAIHDGDEWAEPARLLARAHRIDDVEPVVRHLAALGHRAPSQRWQRQMQDLLESAPSRQLVREWLDAARDVTVASDGHLYTPSNEDLVRAAVIATRWLSVEEAPAELLGTLALRGAATMPPATESLALRVSTAAIDSLVQRAAPADTAQLERLLEDIRRRDLVRRIGQALGSDAVIRAATRDRELAQEKAIAVRAKASPVPKIKRAEVDAMLREHIDDTMRDLGFRKSGRTWRRLTDSRVDVVDFYSSGLHMSVQYGVLFPDLHPENGPAMQRDPKRVKPYELDLSIAESGWYADAATLDLMAQRVRLTISPFLLSCGDRAGLADLLRHGVGMPTNVRGDDDLFFRNRPHPPELALGALACIAGDRTSAEWWLAVAEDAVDPLSHARTQAEIEYWKLRL